MKVLASAQMQKSNTKRSSNQKKSTKHAHLCRYIYEIDENCNKMKKREKLTRKLTRTSTAKSGYALNNGRVVNALLINFRIK